MEAFLEINFRILNTAHEQVESFSATCGATPILFQSCLGLSAN